MCFYKYLGSHWEDYKFFPHIYSLDITLFFILYYDILKTSMILRCIVLIAVLINDVLTGGTD